MSLNLGNLHQAWKEKCKAYLLQSKPFCVMKQIFRVSRFELI